jgi:hypothetical protein
MKCFPKLQKTNSLDLDTFAKQAYFRRRDGANYEVREFVWLKAKIHESIQPIE